MPHELRLRQDMDGAGVRWEKNRDCEQCCTDGRECQNQDVQRRGRSAFAKKS